MMRAPFVIAMSLCVLPLAACSGSGAPNSVPPHPSSSGSSNVSFVLTIPAGAAPATSSATAPRDFSASTQSVTIAIASDILKTADVSATSSLCTASAGGGRTCTVPVEAPSGSDTFTVTAYDQPNGTGNVLASGTVQATISHSSQSIDVIVAGTVARVAVALADPFPPAGTPATTNVVVTGYDADGNAVLGTYATPIALADSDTSGHTKLSPTSVTGSSSSVTFSYDGFTPFTAATITASMPALTPVTATFAPDPSFVTSYAFPQIGVGPFAQSCGPWGLVLGPDGNMWVDCDSTSEIVKIAPDGTMTQFPLPQSYWQLQGMAVGADNAIWFAEYQNNAIAKITTGGTITTYTLPQATALPYALALGKDGNIWFVDQANDLLGRVTPDGQIAEYPLPANSFVNGLASGPDGNLWLTDQGNNTIVKASTSGAILDTFAIPSSNAQPWGISSGPDGNVWFTELAANKIGRITTSGNISEFSVPTGSSDPIDIVPGPDGRMWFSEMGSEVGLGKIGYITTDGSQIRDFSGDGYHVHALAFDKNGTLWYVALQIPFGNQEIGTFVY